MAEPSRTVRVSGLPAHMEEDRLKDKLFIHFLRSGNGGGEVDSVTIVKETPGRALVTFEDSIVAQRVIQRGRHTLEVDGKRYELTATGHRRKLRPDQVVLNLSAMIDCSQLPGGLAAFENLCKDHPEVEVNYVLAGESCALSGAYSKVQAALSDLLGQLAGSESPEESSVAGPGRGASRPPDSFPQEPGEPTRRPRKQTEKPRLDGPSDDHISSSSRDLTPGGRNWEDAGQAASAATQLPPTSVEDCTLIIDADMFQYLQKHCREEYQSILSQYGVEVVDVTNQGLTTLFLHAELSGSLRDGAHEQERLKSAKIAISRLYQENEATIRHGQLSKVLLPPEVEMKLATMALSIRYPKLLMNEDEKNIYLIGSSGDISEAKQFLLDPNNVMDKEEGRASPPELPLCPPLPLYPVPPLYPPLPLYDLGSWTPAAEERLPRATPSVKGPPDQSRDQVLKTDENERRVEGSRHIKLAPQFRNAGRGALGVLPTDLSLRATSSPSRQARAGPVLGRDVLSETAKTSGGSGVSRAAAQSTGGDILFNSSFAPPPPASLQHKTPSNPDLLHARPETSTSSVAATPASPPGGAPLPPAASGAGLRRTSSFSGALRRQSQEPAPRSEDDAGRSRARARGRSSSFSSSEGRVKQDVHTAEVTVSLVAWQYMKEAYKTRVDDLTSDVQVKERRSSGSPDLTLSLRGASSSKVASCQRSLQQLVDSVMADFCVQALRFSDLGVAGKADETLQACCSELRSRFKKITIHVSEECLFLLGPEPLCARIGALVREVFSGSPAPHHRSATSNSKRDSPYARKNEDQSVELHVNSKSKVVPEGKAGKAGDTGMSSQWQTTYRNDFGEKESAHGSVDQTSVQNEPVFGDVEELTGMEETDGPRSSLGSDSSVGHVNGVGSAATESEGAPPATRTDSEGREPASAETTADAPGSGQEGPQVTPCSLCGARGARTKCDACPKRSQSARADCGVRHRTAPRRPGVHGRMICSQLSSSVAGYPKHCTCVVTYRIPDGIQAEGHPSPGKPFQGGEFVAFLPDCQKATKLLPRLKRAFELGLTFRVIDKGTGAKVTWDCIPHKCLMQGGKTNGYPDSTYLTRLSDILASHGIQE